VIIENMQDAIDQVLKAESAGRVESILDEVDRAWMNSELHAIDDDWPNLANAVCKWKTANFA
jgi:hypothetical protein